MDGTPIRCPRRHSLKRSLVSVVLVTVVAGGSAAAQGPSADTSLVTRGQYLGTIMD